MSAWLPMLQDLAPSLAQRPALVLLATGVIVLVTGLAAQIAAYRLGIPSIIFLLASGLLLGPDGLDWVRPALFHHGLRTIITGCVAVIVFESVLRIDPRELRQVSRPVIGLSTLGVATTTLLASLLAWRAVGLPYPVALLFGAIVSITGPTVISPIVRRLPLPSRLKTTLEGESVFADAVGVILAASIFSWISDAGLGAASGAWLFVSRLALGAAIGAALASAGHALLRRLAPLPGEYVRLGVLGTALVVYVSAELATRHLGIMAVAVAALVFGLRPLPYTESIKQFKGDLTLICLSLVFILLAANLPLRQLWALGWPGVGVVAVLMVAIRPLCVAVGTAGAALSWREKAFLAFLAPRGIVAASAATFFALELESLGIGGSETLKGLVFMVVFGTVTLQGGGAFWAARALGVLRPRVLILGGDAAVRRHAQALVGQGQPTLVLDESLDNLHHLLLRGLPARLCRLGDLPAVLRHCPPRETAEIVVATPSDALNFRLAAALRRERPETPVRVRLAAGGAREAERLAGLGLLPWQPAEAPVPESHAPSALEELVPARVGNPLAAGVPLAQLDLPVETLLVSLERDGARLIPRGDTLLALGDRVAIAGEASAVERVRAFLEG